MTIDLPDAEWDRLAEHAKNAGYADLERFVADHLIAIASRPTADEAPAMTDAELHASLAQIDRGWSDIEAGRCTSADEARRRALARFDRPEG